MTHIKRTEVGVLLLVCFLCFAYPNAAKAGPVTSTAALTAGMASYYLNTFTTLTDGIPLTSVLPFSGNGFSYNVAASGTDGLYGIGTTGSPSWLSTFDPGATLTITFTSGNVTAIGGNFFNTNIDTTELTDTITVLLSGVVGSVTLPAPSDTPNDFWGYLSTPGVFITGLTITPNNDDFATLANFYAGAVPAGGTGTPEPATFGLLAAGIAAGLLGKRLSRG